MNTSVRFTGAALLALAAAGCGGDDVIRPLRTDAPVLLESWGGFGSGDGRFHQPIDIARGPDGAIYVTDAQHHRVQKFTPDGEFLDAFGSGFLHFPSAVAVGPDGRVYVSDHTVRVHVLNPDKTYNRWLDYYPGDAGLVMSADGTLLIAGYKIILRSPNLVATGPRVWRVSPEGEEIDSWEGPDDGLSSAWFPMGIAEDKAGRVYVTGSRQHREGPDAVKTGEYVWVFDRRGTFITRFGIEHTPDLVPPLGFEGIALDSRGAVYVAEWHRGTVYKFSRSGDLVMQWSATGDGLPNLTSPVGILIDPSDRIYVTDWSQNLIYKFGYN